MRCEEVRPLISAGLDGELEASRATQVRAHLAECALCSEEREVLAETVRLLRALPEAEPPIELRRRIGAALLAIESAPERRWLGLSLLARPHTTGWAWGAALGMVAATVTLVATRGPERRFPVRPASAPLAAAAIVPPVSPSSPAGTTRPASLTSRAPKAPAAVPVRPAKSTAIAAASVMKPHPLTAPAPPVRAPLEQLAALPTPRPGHPHTARLRPLARRLQMRRYSGPIAALPAHSIARLAPHASVAPKGTEPAASGSPLLAHIDPAPSPGATPFPPPDPDDRTSTAGMTQMASGAAAPDSPAADDDDLSDLRRRLTDRPLQVPELGELKPSSGSHPGRDGWIRF